MRLKRLELTNFKGLRHFVFEPDGNGADIFGANFSCKSTVCNGWHWLLTGKDSAGKQATGRSSFEIKRLDNGVPEHGGENEVEALIELDSRAAHTIKKVFREVWEKHRGGEKTLKGNTVDHFLDGVPVKEKEYLDFLNSIATQEVLQILTNPAYFPSMLPWERRRQILVGLCPEITDEDVYASNPKLEDLRTILEGPPVRTVESHLKVCKARKTELNKAIDDIPVRVSEQKRNIIDGGAQEGPVRAKIAELQKEKSALDTQLVTLESGGAIADKKRELAEIETQLIQLQNKESRLLNENLEAKRHELGSLKFGLGALEADTRKFSGKIAENSVTIRQHKQKMDDLRAEWIALNASVFEAPDTCPTCGQNIPEDQIETARATFNIHKAEGLKGINAEGGRLKELVAGLEAENAKHAETGEIKRQAAEKLSGEIKALEEEIKNPVELTPDSIERQKFQQQKTALESEIASIIENRQGAIDEIREQIAALGSVIQTHNTVLAQIEQNKTSLKRIAELNKEHRDFAGALEKVQREIFLCEEFTRAQAQLITGNVESHFEFAKFKLFDDQLNGTLIPCCEVTTPNGVPFTQDSSGSEKVHAGLDIIKTLSKHYGLTLPIFCDDAERTTDFPKMDSQMIRLYVSREDAILRIERNEENARAAA
jgi:DNA repair exonuclease SbcCD ATPase subunit